MTSPSTRPLNRFLVLSLLLLAQILGIAAPHHAEDEVALLQSEDLLGRTYQPAARHPHQAAHVEAAEPEHHTHPCAACLHLLGFLAVSRPAAPRLVPPQPGVPGVPDRSPLRSRPISSSAGPRAPPCLA